MAYTQAHLDALEAALAKGEKRVSFGDKTVEYRTVDELKAAIREVKRGISEQAVANMRQNLGFAFLYNALGVPIAAGVLYPAFGLLLSPMLAALAMILGCTASVMV